MRLTGAAIVVIILRVTINRRLAGHLAAIPGIERALLSDGAVLSRAQRRAGGVVIVAVAPAAPIVAITNGMANGAAFETHVTSVGHGAGIGVGSAAFNIARSFDTNRQAGFGAGESEIHIAFAGAIADANRDLVVVGLGIAALVAARLAMVAAPIVFPAIAVVAVFPVAGAVFVPPALSSAADAMDVAIILVPAIAAIAVSPVVAGRRCRLAVTRRRSHRHDIATAGKVGEAIPAVGIRHERHHNLVAQQQ